MAKKSILSIEQREAIHKLVQKGFGGTEITKILKEEGIIPQDFKYATIQYRVRRMRTQTIGDKKRNKAEIQIINDLSTLTKTMTSWVNQLRKEYNSAESFEVIGDDRYGRPVAIQPKRDIRNSIDRNFGHFISLLKTPAMAGKGTEVNIGLQNMQIAYDQVIAKNKAKLYGTAEPINVSIPAQRAD